jgi:hypothetical protein
MICLLSLWIFQNGTRNNGAWSVCFARLFLKLSLCFSAIHIYGFSFINIREHELPRILESNSSKLPKISGNFRSLPKFSGIFISFTKFSEIFQKFIRSFPKFSKFFYFKLVLVVTRLLPNSPACCTCSGKLPEELG